MQRIKRGLRKPRFVFAGAALLVLLAASSTLYVGYGGAKNPGLAGEFVELDWPAGLSSAEAARELADAGLVRSASLTEAFFAATGGTSSFVAGPHLLPRDASPWHLRALLRRDPSRPKARVTVPEGLHRFDIGARLEKARVVSKRAFLEATEDAWLLEELDISRSSSSPVESAEGYLFPATYELAEDSDARDVVRRMVREADRRWQPLAETHAASLETLRATLGWGRREIVVLASMIEKETGAADERPLIASVFLNRLIDPGFTPKRLQSDPTAAYGCFVSPAEIPACAGFAGKPTPAINHDARNRYSTYVRSGLPPGPIANPGVASLASVLAPASTKHLYFVAAGGGRHTFSETLEAHNAAVRKLRERASR